MWHAITVQTAATAEDRSDAGPSLGDFGIREPGVETGQSDTLSADANFLTELLWPREPESHAPGEQGTGPSGLSNGTPVSLFPGATLDAGPPKAPNFPVASREPVTRGQPGGGELLEASLLTNLQTEPGETQAGTNGAGWAALATGLIPGAAPSVVSGLAPLLTNGAFVPAAMLMPLAAVGTANRAAPDAVEPEAGAVAGPGSGGKTAADGFLLDAREWLHVEHRPQSIETALARTARDGSPTDPIPVAILSPVAQSPVAGRLSQPPDPTSTGRPLPVAGHGTMPSLAGVGVENTLGVGATQDPLSFVVRVAEDRPLLGGSSPEFSPLRDPETPAGPFPGTSDGPPLEKAPGRASEGSFGRTADPGTVVQVRPMAAHDSSAGGQAEGGDPERSPLAGEESELSSAIPGSGGEHEFSSWVPGHGAEMAGLPARNESGPRPGVTSAKLEETAKPAPEPAPERLTAAPRELVLTIPGRTDGEGVLASVHVRDRHGAVEITVRTPDAQLSSSLQDGLPELVARMETQGTTASATRGDQMSGGPADGGPADGSGMQDGQPQERHPQEGRTGQEPGGGGRDERQPHPEDRDRPGGQPGGQPGSQLREPRQQRQARWQASLGLASR